MSHGLFINLREREVYRTSGLALGPVEEGVCHGTLSGALAPRLFDGRRMCRLRIRVAARSWGVEALIRDGILVVSTPSPRQYSRMIPRRVSRRRGLIPRVFLLLHLTPTMAATAGHWRILAAPVVCPMGMAGSPGGIRSGLAFTPIV
jgi:hypothetical protein